MKIVDKFDYRNAESILEKKHKEILQEVFTILDDPNNKLVLEKQEGKKQRDVARQIQNIFKNKDWLIEQPVFSIHDLSYDVVKGNVPIEIEISYQRQVYADFFKFLIDLSTGKIDAAILIAAGNPEKFGHDWHASLQSSKKKLLDIKNHYLVPILVIGIDP